MITDHRMTGVIRLKNNYRVLRHPTSIEVYYYDKISSLEKAEKIVELMRCRGETPFVVERTNDNRYILVEGFIEYAAILRTQPDYYMHCIVKQDSTDRNRIIRIIKTTFFLENTTWLFKNKYMSKLIRDFYMTPEQIARETKIPLSSVKNSLFDTRVPIHIQKKAADLDVLPIIEEIHRSISIPAEMKPILYERAILPLDHKLNLNSLKLLFFQQFCSTIYIPDYLISNLDLLEQFIDELLINNFRLTSHWNKVLMNFIKENRLLTLPTIISNQ